MSSTVDRENETGDTADVEPNDADAQPWYPDGPPTLAKNGGGNGDGDDDDDDDGEPFQPWWQRPLNIAGMILTAAICFSLIGWSVGAERQGRHSEVDVGFLQDMRVHHEQATYMSLLYLSRPDTDPQIQVVAVSILQGQNIEIGRMIQLLRLFGADEAANLDEPRMQWMGQMTTSDGTAPQANEADDPGTEDPATDDTATDGMDGMDGTDGMDGMAMDEPETSNGVALMPGMATEAELDTLNTLDGRSADELFVRLMIDHHRGGIDMADYAAEHGRSPEVRSMADSMSHGQQSEIKELSTLIAAEA